MESGAGGPRILGMAMRASDVLWVTGVNEGAQRFYDRIGFRVMTEGADAESGRRFGALAMEREIGRVGLEG